MLERHCGVMDAPPPQEVKNECTVKHHKIDGIPPHTQETFGLQSIMGHIGGGVRQSHRRLDMESDDDFWFLQMDSRSFLIYTKDNQR